MSCDVPHVGAEEEVIRLNGEDETTHADEKATRRDPVGQEVGEGHAVNVVRTFGHEVAELFCAICVLERSCCDRLAGGRMSLQKRLAR